MTVHYADSDVTLHHGDCLDVMRDFADASVDAVITDPPYLLGFMGKDWDSRAAHEHLDWHRAWVDECLRLLKPGGYLLSFGGTRTWHRLACAVEDAGFEVRDSIAWLHGQGFPKGKQQLKPAFEPIVMGRKPGATGSLNVDACRVAAGQDYLDKCASVIGLASNRNGSAYGEWTGERTNSAHADGRWPTNVLLDDEAAVQVDQEGGYSAGKRMVKSRPGSVLGNGVTLGDFTSTVEREGGYDDAGGASRYFPVFKYIPKATTAERPRDGAIVHPTVKPLDLMRWLVRLVASPGDLVLEPFAGSGTTAEACVREGVRCLAIERESDYLPLIVQRLHKPMQVGLDLGDLA